ncbi:MAG TPA: SIMPL domain-containing protein [Candidatus Baltobacteraceae bacterium]|jgi:uncharacterized protein YggE
MRSLFLIVCLLLIAAPLAADAQQVQANEAQQGPPGITVLVTGTARSDSLDAKMTFDLTTASRDVGRSVRENDERYAGFVAGLKPLNIEVRLESVALSTLEKNTQTVTRECSLTVPASEIARVQAIATEHGAKASPFGAVTFVLPNEPELYKGAAASAIAQARERATAIAAANGQKIGPLLNWAPSPLDLLKQAAATINPFAPGAAGLATVSVSGTATFKLLP